MISCKTFPKIQGILSSLRCKMRFKSLEQNCNENKATTKRFLVTLIPRTSQMCLQQHQSLLNQHQWFLGLYNFNLRQCKCLGNHQMQMDYFFTSELKGLLMYFRPLQLILQAKTYIVRLLQVIRMELLNKQWGKPIIDKCMSPRGSF